jgi:hypothetical protein
MNDQQQKAANTKKFLEELGKLSEKHGIVIGGCGCCGSPYIYDAQGKGVYTVNDDNDLKWEQK